MNTNHKTNISGISEAFAEIDRLQAESEDLVKKFAALKLEKSLVNIIAMRVSGADVAAVKIIDIFDLQWSIMEKWIFPIMYKDIRNKETFDACLEDLKTTKSPSPAKLVCAIARLIAALKNMLKIV